MMPPAESTGSTTSAHSDPTDCWSTRSNPASRHVQSQVPSQWRIGQRYAYGAGSANEPGTSGPDPPWPIGYVIDPLPASRPGDVRARPTTSNRPVESFASLTATSLASEPVLSSITRSSGSGARPASRSPSASTGSGGLPEVGGG